jgi:hypothetical protein
MSSSKLKDIGLCGNVCRVVKYQAVELCVDCEGASIGLRGNSGGPTKDSVYHFLEHLRPKRSRC